MPCSATLGSASCPSKFLTWEVVNWDLPNTENCTISKLRNRKHFQTLLTSLTWPSRAATISSDRLVSLRLTTASKLSWQMGWRHRAGLSTRKTNKIISTQVVAPTPSCCDCKLPGLECCAKTDTALTADSLSMLERTASRPCISGVNPSASSRSTCAAVKI